MVRQFGLGAVLVSLIASTSWGVLTHQYTFNDGTANDSVGTAHGTLVNLATVAAGQLQLSNPNFSGPSTAGKYLSLPPSILPTSGSVTIEQWFTFTGSGFFTEAWTFSNSNNDTQPPGANTGQYLMHTISAPQGGPVPSGGGSHVAQALSGYAGSLTPPPGPETDAYGTTPGLGAFGGGYLDDGATYFAATVIDGGAGTLSYYVWRASDKLGGLQQTITAVPLSSYSFTNAYLGRSAFPGDNSTTGTVDEFSVYNEARSTADVTADFNNGPIGGGPRVTVDRTTGLISLTNTAAAVKIFNYSINSASGSLLTANMRPVSGRLDEAANGGTGAFDNNDAWDVVTNTAFTLSETDRVAEGAEDGGTVGTVALSTSSPGGWIKSFRQDITASIQIMDGANFTTFNIPVIYTGNSNLAFKRSDLDFNNAINGADWTIFKNNNLKPIDPALTIAQTSALGDLDGDKDNDVQDFRLFKTDYIAANGPGAWEALQAVPEPGSLALFAVGCALALATRCRASRRSLTPSRAAWLAAALAMGPAISQAAVTHKYTFNNGTANDSIGTANGTLTNGASISVGGQLALDGVNDFLSLPGAGIAINSYPNATFEGWFTINAQSVWQRLFDFGNTNAGGQGANYIFYSPSSGGNDNRAALSNSDPGGGQEDDALAGLPLSTGVQHHVAVVVDQSGAHNMSVYVDGALATGAANPVTLTRTLAGLSNTFAYLGKSTYNPDPTLNGFVDEFRIYDNALSAAQVQADFQAGPELLDILALNVNTQTGNISLKNTSNSPKSFDYYQISSSGGKLKPTNGNWNSLDDQNIDALGANPGQSWDEAGGASVNTLAELFLRGTSTLDAGAAINLGSAYNTGLGAGDLKFTFALAGGELVTGKVNYVTGISDFNGDTRTDGADFLTWQRNFGATGASLSQGDGDGNGTVNNADLTIWRNGYGSAVAVSAAVPEPASCCLAAIVLFAALRQSRARRH